MPRRARPPGGSRTYRLYADTRKIGGSVVSDYGGANSDVDGLYGEIVVAPSGATFTNPVTGAATQFGVQVDVHVQGTSGYRDFTAMMADNDAIVSGSFMPYPISVSGRVQIDYANAIGATTGGGGTGGPSVTRPDDANTFSSPKYGDPKTPILRAYAGDPTHVHFMVAPGSKQIHVFNLGGQSWPADGEIPESQSRQSQGVGPWESFDAVISGGAGGVNHTVGDFFYGDIRRPFTQAGMWGVMRVLSDTTCPIKPLDGLPCAGQP